MNKAQEYAKSITKNETYQSYLIKAYEEGAANQYSEFDHIQITGIEFYELGFSILWNSDLLGFGTTSFVRCELGICVDNEGMSKELVKAVLSKATDKYFR